MMWTTRMLRRQHGAKTKAVNLWTSTTASPSNFVRALIFLATGKQLRSENVTATPLQVHAR